MVADAEKVLQLLAETPIALGESTRGVEALLLGQRPSADEWSANDVLAHLRSCADVWGGCIERILAEGAPTIRAVNPRTYLPSTDYPDLDFEPSLDAFVAQRRALLDVLAGLSPSDWSQSAAVIGAGRPLQRSVLGYAEWLATHERAHVKQVARVVVAVSARV